MSSSYPPDEEYPPNQPWGRGPEEEPSDATLPGGERQPVRLRMQLGQSIGQLYTMVGNTLTMGRAPDNDVVLDDPQVSRHHARLMRRGDQIMVEDLGSTNGTLVNGRRISGTHVLQPTETIAVGGSVFSVEGFPAPSTIGMPPYYREGARPEPPTTLERAQGREAERSSWLAIGWVGGLLILVVLILALAGLTAWLLTRDQGEAAPSVPTVFIQSPVAGSQVPINQPVTVNATASDPNGITRVELWVGGNVVDQQQSAVAEGQPTFPVTMTWTPTAPGIYTLEVRAYSRLNVPSAPTTVMISVAEGQAAVDTPTPSLPGDTPTPSGPATALTTADLNVRGGPGENYPVLALLPVNTQVDVTGKDPSGIWWQIVHPPGSGERGWIYAPFTRGTNTESVPVVETPVPPTPTDIPTPTSTATQPPTVTPTSTRAPTPTPTIAVSPVVEFGVTQGTINPGQCTQLQWHIENIRAAFLNGGEFNNFGITGPFGSRQVCPGGTTTYVLRAEADAGPVERSVTVTVRSEQSATLNHVAGGWVREDGAVFTPQPFVGDDNTDQALRAFFAFDLSSLAGARITNAQLDLGDYNISGAPFDTLQPLHVEEVEWAPTLEGSDYGAGVAADLATMGGAAGLDNPIDVSGRVAARVDAGSNSFQIRLRFETDDDDDGVNDSVNWAGRTARLVVRYTR
jgi:hypothetical protein